MSIALVVVAALLFAIVGSRWAVASRARSDYARTRDGLPGMRRTAHAAFWAATRTVVLIVLIAAGFAAWQVRDVTPGGVADDARKWISEHTPSPAPSTSPARRAGAGGDSGGPVTDDGRVICFSAECRRQHPE